MARSHGKILVDIWLDPDFLALERPEQWCYFMLLSQPKLTLVGSIDYRPAHWCGLTPSDAPATIDASIRLLEEARFVVVDRVTEELLVRSITKHDGLRTGNPKLMKGLWTAWKGIGSMHLKKVAVDNMPPALFDTEEAPRLALDMRRSPRTDCSIRKATDRSNEPPSSFLLPTSTAAQSDSQRMPEGNRTLALVEGFPEARAALKAGQQGGAA